MLAKGNGESEMCIRNLLLMEKGEAFLKMDKGLDRGILDRPFQKDLVLQEMRRILNDFEPRVDHRDIDLACEKYGYLLDLHIDKGDG